MVPHTSIQAGQSHVEQAVSHVLRVAGERVIDGFVRAPLCDGDTGPDVRRLGCIAVHDQGRVGHVGSDAPNGPSRKYPRWAPAEEAAGSIEAL